MSKLYSPITYGDHGTYVAEGGFIPGACILPEKVTVGKSVYLRLVGEHSDFNSEIGIYYTPLHNERYTCQFILDTIQLAYIYNGVRTVVIDFGPVLEGQSLIAEKTLTSIEDIVGEVAASRDFTITFEITYYYHFHILYEYFWWLPPFWYYGWERDYSLSAPIESLDWDVYVEIPPPEPLFVADLCYVAKETVAPNEEFAIKATIKNHNEYPGEYYLGCYCKGRYSQFTTGDLGANQQKEHDFIITANELAGEVITTSQMLVYYVVTGYLDKAGNRHETDRWSPPVLYVIVVEGEASLSGTVTDSEGLALSGVTVEDGLPVTTNASGNYSFTGLDIRWHTIKFSKDGYKTQKVAKYLYSGYNFLDVTLSKGIPWVPAVITAGIVAVAGGATYALVRRIRG